MPPAILRRFRAIAARGHSARCPSSLVANWPTLAIGRDWPEHRLSQIDILRPQSVWSCRPVDRGERRQVAVGCPRAADTELRQPITLPSFNLCQVYGALLQPVSSSCTAAKAQLDHRLTSTRAADRVLQTFPSLKDAARIDLAYPAFASVLVHR